MALIKHIRKWILSRRLPREVIVDALNGDCIEEVLRRIVYLDHFLTVSRVCPDFVQGAKNCFRARFKHVEIVDSAIYPPNCVPSERARVLLSTFGRSIESLSWTGCSSNRERNDYIFNLITKYCGERLKELNITRYNPDFDQVEFKSLEKLDMHHSSPQNFRSYSSLKMLSIRQLKSLEHDNIWFIHEMPNLEQMEFDGVNDLTNEMLTQFLSLNPKLRCLKVKDCQYITPLIFATIRNSAPNIEKLAIFFHRSSDFSNAVWNENISHLSFLRKLKSLSSNFGRYITLDTITNMFAENSVPIEELSLVSLDPSNGKSERVLKLKTLKHLKIGSPVESIFEDVLLNMVKSQTTLETINVEVNGWRNISMWTIERILKHGKNLTQFSCEVKVMDIDLGSYESLLQLVKGRVKTKIEVFRGVVDVPENVLKANQKWLNVIVSNRYSN